MGGLNIFPLTAFFSVTAFFSKILFRYKINEEIKLYLLEQYSKYHVFVYCMKCISFKRCHIGFFCTFLRKDEKNEDIRVHGFGWLSIAKPPKAKLCGNAPKVNNSSRIGRGGSKEFCAIVSRRQLFHENSRKPD